MKRIVAILLSALLLASLFTVAVSAEGDRISVRIEGIEKNLFTGEIEIADDTTVADVLMSIDKNNEDISIVGIEDNFITEVNGEITSSFGGWDGWNYSVNDEVPSVGIGDYKLTPGDVVVLYYADYPSQIPVADLSKVNEGVIKVSSYDTQWIEDENGEWIPVSEWVPITGATVNLTDGNKISEYITDEKGVINFSISDFSGTVNGSIDKKSASGAPAVCRESFSFEIKNNTSSDSTAPSETETTAPITTEPSSVAKTTVTATVAKTEIYVNQTTTVKANVTNPKGKTSFISNKKSVATVDSNGKIKANKKGKATISVKNNGVTAKVTITVKNPKLNKKSIKLKKGQTFKIKITGKSGKQTYTSSNKKVAKVSKSGKVKANKKGTAVITVKTNKSIKLKLKVKVK
ncbi:MAG: DUF4430 domain-containing protein [Ruminococcus sp.]|nr:DUF4430 domain-containing protein [Ruminococcus sp.]